MSPGSDLDCSIYGSQKEIIQSLPFWVSINPTGDTPITSYARVVREGSVTELTLVIPDTIPLAIFCLSELNSLTIKYGTDLSIPSEIARLSYTLTSVNLLGISRSLSLPLEFFNLKRLQTLSIISCGLNTLPEAIGQLSSLNKLTLTSNQLSTLPESLGKLRTLSELVLHGNPSLTSLDALSGSPSLTSLNASNCSIDHFPRSLSYLSNIELSGNKLTSLEGLMSIVSNVTETLLLASNNITVIPEAIGTAKQLRVLDVSNNALKELSDSLYTTGSLRNIFATKNQFSSKEIEWIQGICRSRSITVYV